MQRYLKGRHRWFYNIYEKYEYLYNTREVTVQSHGGIIQYKIALRETQNVRKAIGRNQPVTLSAMWNQAVKKPAAYLVMCSSKKLPQYSVVLERQPAQRIYCKNAV